MPVVEARSGHRVRTMWYFTDSFRGHRIEHFKPAATHKLKPLHFTCVFFAKRQSVALLLLMCLFAEEPFQSRCSYYDLRHVSFYQHVFIQNVFKRSSSATQWHWNATQCYSCIWLGFPLMDERWHQSWKKLDHCGEICVKSMKGTAWGSKWRPQVSSLFTGQLHHLPWRTTLARTNACESENTYILSRWWGVPLPNLSGWLGTPESTGITGSHASLVSWLLFLKFTKNCCNVDREDAGIWWRNVSWQCRWSDRARSLSWGLLISGSASWTASRADALSVSAARHQVQTRLYQFSC